MSHISVRSALLTLSALSLFALPGMAGELSLPKPKPVTVNGRFIAKAPLPGYVTVGANYESFLFKIEDSEKQASPGLIKFSYRFQPQDPRIPGSLFDYTLVHRFTMVRDESCDETWSALSVRYLFDEDGKITGKTTAMQFAPNAPKIDLTGDATLKCYVVTPKGYRTTLKNAPKKQTLKQTAEKESSEKHN